MAPHPDVGEGAKPAIGLAFAGFFLPRPMCPRYGTAFSNGNSIRCSGAHYPGGVGRSRSKGLGPVLRAQM